jgi:hypothetical protein
VGLEVGASKKRLYRAKEPQWSHFRARRNDDVGFFAAWAADEELLGRKTLVNRTLAHELRGGRLRASSGPEHGRRFVRDLKVDLRRWGYS